MISANPLAVQLADEIEAALAAKNGSPGPGGRFNLGGAAAPLAADSAGPPILSAAGGLPGPGLDEPAATASPPVAPGVVAADALGKVKGKPVPSRAAQVTTQAEMLRVVKVDARGKHQLVSDYTVQEIATGGPDIEAFIARVVVPQYGAGDYLVLKHERGVLVPWQNVSIAPSVAAPLPSSTIVPGVPSPSLRELAELQDRARAAERSASEAAEAKARAEEDRRAKDRADLLAGLAEKQRRGEGSALDTILLMRVLEGDKREDPRVGQFADAIAQLHQRLDMIASMPPPMPPPAPVPQGPSPVDWINAISAAVGGLVTPIVAAIDRRADAAAEAARASERAREASAMTPERAMGLAVTVLGIAEKAGMIGKSDPLKDALAQRIMAEVNAEPADPLEHITKVIALVDQLRPKDSGAKDFLGVLDHAIDRLPDVFDSFGRLADKQAGGGGRVPMLTGPTGERTIPAPLAKLRAEVLRILGEQPEGRERHIAILRLVIPGLGQVARAGGAWRTDMEELLHAALAEDVELVKRIFARVVRRAWPDKADEKAKQFFHAIRETWEKYPREIAWLLSGKPPPGEEGKAKDESDGSDLAGEAAAEGAANTGETAAEGAKEGAEELTR